MWSFHSPGWLNLEKAKNLEQRQAGKDKEQRQAGKDKEQRQAGKDKEPIKTSLTSLRIELIPPAPWLERARSAIVTKSEVWSEVRKKWAWREPPTLSVWKITSAGCHGWEQTKWE